MKKLFLLPFFLISSLFALSSGSYATPGILKEGIFIPSSKWISVRLGYEGDFVIDRRLVKTSSPHKIDRFESFQQGGSLTLNFYNRLDLYGYVGGAKIYSYFRMNDSLTTQYRREMETKNSFAWATGGRALLFEWGKMAIGINGKYFHTEPEFSWAVKDGAPLPIDSQKFDWDEWQVDLGLSYHMDLFFPYLGVSYSEAKVRWKNIPFEEALLSDSGLSFKNENDVGMIIGCTISTEKNFFFTVEGRFFNENAITLFADLRF